MQMDWQFASLDLVATLGPPATDAQLPVHLNCNTLTSACPCVLPPRGCLNDWQGSRAGSRARAITGRCGCLPFQALAPTRGLFA